MSNLKPDKKNANKGTERGRELLQNSLAKYGAGRSILVDKHGNIIAGNKTFEQASAMGLKVRTIETSGDELVVVQRNDLDLYEGTTARELAYADNRVAEVDLAWESEQVAADFASGIDLNALGFSEKDLKDILGDLYPEETKDAEPQIDRAAELAEKWQTKSGQLWKLGEHRLLIGDCTVRENVERLMGGERADICWTDPPWNVAYGENMKSDNPQRYKVRTIENDNLGEKFGEFATAFCLSIKNNLKDGGILYMAMSAQEWGTIMQELKNAGFHWSSTIIWNKDHLVMSRKDYHTKYEPIWYGWLDNAPRLFQVEDRKQSDVWDIDRPTKSEEHPTMKPVALVERSLRNSSVVGSVVFEPFGGSGTTIIASHNLNRRCYAMEISEKYGAVILERFYTATGIMPELEIVKI